MRADSGGSDEHTLYVKPEDDLTAVRVFLEQIPLRRITLVIPVQTQLRSHVAWKLLHARARELGKEVLIISSDPQIRSVAQAVKFKVAHSESSATDKPLPGSRPPLPRNARRSTHFKQAQEIRQAASNSNNGDKRPSSPPSLSAPEKMSNETFPIKESPQLSFSNDPLAYTDDILPQPLAEKHGAVSIDKFNVMEATILPPHHAPLARTLPVPPPGSHTDPEPPSRFRTNLCRTTIW